MDGPHIAIICASIVVVLAPGLFALGLYLGYKLGRDAEADRSECTRRLTDAIRREAENAARKNSAGVYPSWKITGIDPRDLS